MQVGDLVTLSAYGKKIKRTGWIKEGDVGIIKKVGPWSSYRVLWCKSTYRYTQSRDYPTRGNYYDWEMSLNPRDLKFAK
tara:strand:+ start:370 stop:606 length:237 start_codon:yes stop_codon:yes gene_type:complete